MPFVCKHGSAVWVLFSSKKQHVSSTGLGGSLLSTLLSLSLGADSVLVCTLDMVEGIYTLARIHKQVKTFNQTFGRPITAAVKPSEQTLRTFHVSSMSLAHLSL